MSGGCETDQYTNAYTEPEQQSSKRQIQIRCTRKLVFFCPKTIMTTFSNTKCTVQTGFVHKLQFSHLIFFSIFILYRAFYDFCMATEHIAVVVVAVMRAK